MPVLRVISLLYSLIPAIGVLATGSAAGTGFSCLADPKQIIGWVMIPIAVVAWPGVAITLFTVVYLVRLLFSSPGVGAGKGNTTEKGMNSTNSAQSCSLAATRSVPTIASNSKPVSSYLDRLTSSATNLDSVSSEVTKPKFKGDGAGGDNATKLAKQLKLHKERVWGVLQKAWRSIALSVAIVVTFGSFWTTSIEIAVSFANVSSATPWLAS
ncbi:hypothetical protein HDU99_008682, partial [Rhizoclosmatium hyalinum]